MLLKMEFFIIVNLRPSGYGRTDMNPQKKEAITASGIFCSEERDRTADLRVMNPTL